MDCGEAELRGGFVPRGTVRRTCGEPFCGDVAMAREERSEVVCHCGLHGVVLKFILDKFVAFAVFGRAWFLWSYWQPLEPNARVNTTRYTSLRLEADARSIYISQISLRRRWCGPF